MYKRRGSRSYRSSSKKTFRYKKRYFKSKLSPLAQVSAQYDSGVAVKCFVKNQVLNENTGNMGNHFVNWGSQAGAPALTTASDVSQSAEFVSMAALYNEYTVTGVKIVVQPSQYVNPANQATDTLRLAIQMGSIPGIALGAATAPGQLMAAQDFRTYNCNATNPQGLQKYINVSKYYWSRGEKYISTADQMSLAGTLVRIPTVNESLNVVLADVFVTYYVKFKGQKA